jgi:glycosyltransferase involved in cell wall biosynthesis
VVRTSITLFVPVYNASETVAASIASAVRNLVAGDEIVAVDDGSTDDSREVLARLQETTPMLRVIEHGERRGGGAARNTAVENSRNDLLFCLDADNVLRPRSLRRLVHHQHSTGADAAAFQMVLFFQRRPRMLEVTHRHRYAAGEHRLADLLGGTICPPASGNYLFTKKSWARSGGYPEVTTLDTWGFGLRQLAAGDRMVVMPRSGYFHRYGHDSNYVRELGAGNTDRIANELIGEITHLLAAGEVERVSATPGWLHHLDEVPLRLATNEVSTVQGVRLGEPRPTQAWGVLRGLSRRLRRDKQSP